MSREDMLRDLSRDTGLRYYECDRFLDALVEWIWEKLSRGEEVRIKHLGLFYIKYVPPKKRYNNFTKEHYVAPECNIIKFQFSPDSRKRAQQELNNAVRNGDIDFWQ